MLHMHTCIMNLLVPNCAFSSYSLVNILCHSCMLVKNKTKNNTDLCVYIYLCMQCVLSIESVHVL